MFLGGGGWGGGGYKQPCLPLILASDETNMKIIHMDENKKLWKHFSVPKFD